LVQRALLGGLFLVDDAQREELEEEEELGVDGEDEVVEEEGGIELGEQGQLVEFGRAQLLEHCPLEVRDLLLGALLLWRVSGRDLQLLDRCLGGLCFRGGGLPRRALFQGWGTAI